MFLFDIFKLMTFPRSNSLNSTQLKNNAFAESQLSEWLKTRKGQSVVIHSPKQFHFFDTHAEAYDYAYEKFKLKNVIIKKIEEDKFFEH